MQSSQHRNRQHVARWLCRPRRGLRHLPFQPLVRPRGVIELVDIFPKQTLKMRLVEYDHVVQHLSPQTAPEALHEGILPGTPKGRPHVFNLAALQETGESLAVDPVVIRLRLPSVRLICRQGTKISLE